MKATVWCACAFVCLASVLGLSLWGCDDDDNPTGPINGITSYDSVYTWTCATSVSCQDVFNITFSASSTVTFQATETTGNSVLQIALYGPGVALGGTNLFTGSTNELLCNFVLGCSNNTAGQTVNDFVIPTNGVYRLAVTREWGSSCNDSGTYRLIIDSDEPFSEPVQTVNDMATQAPGTECP